MVLTSTEAGTAGTHRTVPGEPNREATPGQTCSRVSAHGCTRPAGGKGSRRQWLVTDRRRLCCAAAALPQPLSLCNSPVFGSACRCAHGTPRVSFHWDESPESGVSLVSSQVHRFLAPLFLTILGRKGEAPIVLSDTWRSQAPPQPGGEPELAYFFSSRQWLWSSSETANPKASGARRHVVGGKSSRLLACSRHRNILHFHTHTNSSPIFCNKCRPFQCIARFLTLRETPA